MSRTARWIWGFLCWLSAPMPALAQASISAPLPDTAALAGSFQFKLISEVSIPGYHSKAWFGPVPTQIFDITSEYEDETSPCRYSCTEIRNIVSGNVVLKIKRPLIGLTSPDGTLMAEDDDKNRIVFYSFTSSGASVVSKVKRPFNKTVSVLDVSVFSGRAEYYATTGSDSELFSSSVALVDPAKGKLIGKVSASDAINFMSFSADSTKLNAACADGTLHVWQLPALTELHVFNPMVGGIVRVWDLPNQGMMLIVTNRRELIEIDSETGAVRGSTTIAGNSDYDLLASPDGRLVTVSLLDGAQGSWAYSLQVLDARTLRIVNTLIDHQHVEDLPCTMQFNHDSSMFLYVCTPTHSVFLARVYRVDRN